jgi:hypothetical protein
MRKFPFFWRQHHFSVAQNAYKLGFSSPPGLTRWSMLKLGNETARLSE